MKVTILFVIFPFEQVIIIGCLPSGFLSFTFFLVGFAVEAIFEGVFLEVNDGDVGLILGRDDGAILGTGIGAGFAEPRIMLEP